jgi:hypothetical protein
MGRSTKISITLITATIFGITALTASNQPTARQTDASQLRPVVKPLRLADGTIVVDLRCGEVLLVTPSRLEKFSCTLKNSTDKPILAANVEYSIIVESDGKSVTDTRSHTLDTYIDPDLYDPNKAILPGAERNVEPPGPMYFDNSVVKGIEVRVEYVEFDDKTTAGDSKKGAEVIADIRAGAAKYKKWLVQKYSEHGRAGEALMPLLQQNLSVPSELNIKKQNEELGARAYRTRLRVIAEAKGASELNKYLK